MSFPSFSRLRLSLLLACTLPAAAWAQTVTAPKPQVMPEPVLNPQGQVIPYDGKKVQPEPAPAPKAAAGKKAGKTGKSSKVANSDKAKAAPAAKKSSAPKQHGKKK